MATMAQDRAIAAPPIHPDNRAFWDGTAAGRLLVPHCLACGRPHWYPRPHCPLCMSDKLEWRAASGLGEVYSFSVGRRVGPQPYAIAYVRLDEGVTLLTNLVDCDLDSLHIGQRVRLAMKPAEGGVMLPMFTPL